MWWKRFKRRHRFTRKRNLTYLLFLFILLSMGLGYAVLNTTLGIDGISQLANAKWDIHFDNIQVKEGSVTPTNVATITDDTTVSFSVTLENPGDYYDFNIDVVNAGTINAMIDTVSIQPVLTVAQQKYLDYIVTYEDGVSLAENQRLDAGDRETLRIAFIYKEGDPEDYPDEDEDIPIEVSIIYVQENGDIIDVPHSPTLYGVLKDAAKEGTYAKEYTGAHKDSFTQNPSKKIYHWYADNDTEGTVILDKNNVIFAGQCWQMIRTTDTGGVKMIYNGEAENNQCLNTRGGHFGYETPSFYTSYNNRYWYGTQFIYDEASDKFQISGDKEQIIADNTTGPTLIGKYTCRSYISETATCSTIYQIIGYNNNILYYVPISSNYHYSHIGVSYFNNCENKMISPGFAGVGYQYGDVYENGFKYGFETNSFIETENYLSSGYFYTRYLYSKDISFDGTNYTLINPILGSNIPDETYEEYYTFESATISSGEEPRYLISSITNTTSQYDYYYVTLSPTKQLSGWNLKISSSITDQGNGTFSLNNPITVTPREWIDNNSTYANYYTCGDATVICSRPKKIDAPGYQKYTYIADQDKILIAKSRNGLSLSDTITVTKEEWKNNYSNYTNYKYTCNSTSSTCTDENLRMILKFYEKEYVYVPNLYFGTSVTWDGENYHLQNIIDLENQINYNALATHHFMCIPFYEKICSKVAFIHYTNEVTKGNDFSVKSLNYHYIVLENGVETIEQALTNMYEKNERDSDIKKLLDFWYEEKIKPYDTYIEDTIFCNNRTITKYGGFSYNGSLKTNQDLLFEAGKEIDLICKKEIDSFSTFNNQAHLKYKVGLMTSSEMNMLNSDILRRTDRDYWLLSPSSSYISQIYLKAVKNTGEIGSLGTTLTGGVRPALSLKPGIEYISGDGSMANPYVVAD